MRSQGRNRLPPDPGPRRGGSTAEPRSVRAQWRMWISLLVSAPSASGCAASPFRGQTIAFVRMQAQLPKQDTGLHKVDICPSHRLRASTLECFLSLLAFPCLVLPMAPAPARLALPLAGGAGWVEETRSLSLRGRIQTLITELLFTPHSGRAWGHGHV